jgi:hypothetical protein
LGRRGDRTFFPQALGLGYNIINDFFAGSLPIAFTGSFALFLLMLFLAKLGTSSFTIGSGGSGGVFSPSLFMGAMLGAIFGLMINALFPAISPGYASFAFVGMAVIFAGAAKAPLMSTIIIAEMSQNLTLLPALLIASVMSYLVSGPGSIYLFKEMRLEKREEHDEYMDTPQIPVVARFTHAITKKLRGKRIEEAETSSDKEQTKNSEFSFKPPQRFLLLIKLDPQKRGAFCDKVSALPEKPTEGIRLHGSYNILEHWDVLIWFDADSNDRAISFVNEYICYIDGVRETRALPVTLIKDYKKIFL